MGDQQLQLVAQTNKALPDEYAIPALRSGHRMDFSDDQYHFILPLLYISKNGSAQLSYMYEHDNGKIQYIPVNYSINSPASRLKLFTTIFNIVDREPITEIGSLKEPNTALHQVLRKQFAELSNSVKTVTFAGGSSSEVAGTHVEEDNGMEVDEGMEEDTEKKNIEDDEDGDESYDPKQKPKRGTKRRSGGEDESVLIHTKTLTAEDTASAAAFHPSPSALQNIILVVGFFVYCCCILVVVAIVELERSHGTRVLSLPWPPTIHNEGEKILEKHSKNLSQQIFDVHGPQFAAEENAVQSPLIMIWDLSKQDKRIPLRLAKVQPSNRPHKSSREESLAP
ncbi:hypothetical protein BDP27DRAFT_1368524 [Rhodocollybia butyracea]|uniref:Uncharacterized protein n=1 Tax=Rhodocollybia butyracea TaxID=206335 RepID=A0A9P5PFB3_9AGAR|nr:hypothetical protein BDP27DRAFT_1368524 [Rhodocollybia butyracea]